MDTLAEKLDEKLRQWKPETAAEVRERVAEVIELAHNDGLDLIRSRSSEQDFLDLLDDSSPRTGNLPRMYKGSARSHK